MLGCAANSLVVESHEGHLLDMAWARPQFAHHQVNNAGDILIDQTAGAEEAEKALEIINNWRSSHAFPLQCLKMTLKSRAKRVYPHALVAQRLKRLPAIKLKLSSNKNMQLSKMQDIGGCRAVLRNVSEAERLVRVCEESTAKNPQKRAEFIKKYDYIAQPKDDGYRSVHLVYKYRTSSADLSIYNGLRIEIQVRSRLQHAWATAFETVSTFSGRSVRSQIDDAWKRFFALMGTAVARTEGRIIVSGTPTDKSELAQELRTLIQQLQVEARLSGWSEAITIVKEEISPKAEIFLLVLDSEEMILRYEAFQRDEAPKAAKEYAKVEKNNIGKANVQAVLVSVDSVRDIPRAYPNYSLDTDFFIKIVREAVK